MGHITKVRSQKFFISHLKHKHMQSMQIGYTFGSDRVNDSYFYLNVNFPNFR